MVSSSISARVPYAFASPGKETPRCAAPPRRSAVRRKPGVLGLSCSSRPYASAAWPQTGARTGCADRRRWARSIRFQANSPKRTQPESPDLQPKLISLPARLFSHLNENHRKPERMVRSPTAAPAAGFARGSARARHSPQPAASLRRPCSNVVRNRRPAPQDRIQLAMFQPPPARPAGWRPPPAQAALRVRQTGNPLKHLFSVRQFQVLSLRGSIDPCTEHPRSLYARKVQPSDR